MPPIVGETQIDRRMTNKFCANGMAVYILNVVQDLTIDEEVELSGKFGIMGMSPGGMISTYVAGSDPDILVSVIVIGGGNVPGILTCSDQARIVEIREKRMAKFNIPSLQAYENTFKILFQMIQSVLP